jgi:hypothetical protein
MKQFCLTLAASLSLFFALPARADFPGDWSGAVTIAAITLGGNGEFTVIAPNAPNPGSCNGYYHVYLNQAMGITTTFGLEMLHKQVVAALLSGKKVSIFRTNDVYCYVGFIQLNAN